jgi:hypothetical protein
VDSLEALGLTDERLARVLGSFKAEFEASAPFFR